MRKTVIIPLLFFVTASFGQSIYKGLEYGMSKKEAVAAFKADRDTYINIDFGNDFKYRIYQQNFQYEDDKLVCVPLNAKGGGLGLSYNGLVGYLEYTRNFFESLGYQTFIEPEFWNAPLNYSNSGSKWGLILFDADKTKILQMYPTAVSINSGYVYNIILKVWHHDTWMDHYETSQQVNAEKAKKSGF